MVLEVKVKSHTYVMREAARAWKKRARAVLRPVRYAPRRKHKARTLVKKATTAKKTAMM